MRKISMFLLRLLVCRLIGWSCVFWLLAEQQRRRRQRQWQMYTFRHTFVHTTINAQLSGLRLFPFCVCVCVPYYWRLTTDDCRLTIHIFIGRSLFHIFQFPFVHFLFFRFVSRYSPLRCQSVDLRWRCALSRVSSHNDQTWLRSIKI